ncbi:MmcQ/YjbR family DNA-binding protein [Singulisphaera sp. PoT]|uniref:MmcQ/YjbR family DNA-binding protein n=1 Tax=Singulisphaera sp. PoT TaxID=3411797 RepID=UPI003BF4DA12
MARTTKSANKPTPATWETVRRLALELPEVEEGTSYGTPAFKVRKVLFVRQHQDGESLVIKIDMDERAMRMKVDPETYYITDHYLDHPYILVRLATVDEEDLRELLQESWRRSAPKKLLDAYDSSQG